MSMYTMRLKDVLEEGGGHYDFTSGACYVDAPEVIGLAAYPIFRAEYRERLNGLIFARYMNEEIGSESASMFRLAMMRTMNENMSVFNKLYETTEMEYDPLSTVDLRTLTTGHADQSGTSAGSSEQSAETASGTRAISSEFPQVQLAGNKDYATSGADTNATTNTAGTNNETGESSSETNTENTSHMSGYQGHTVALIEAYRNSLINVDLMVLDSLANLFIQLWDVPEQYTNRGTFNAYYPAVY